MLVIHTREGHTGDLSDCPPSKLSRWAPGSLPMGQALREPAALYKKLDESVVANEIGV